MQLIEDYKKYLNNLYEHVGFKEDFVVCPIDDCTDKYWNIKDNIVKYADSIEQFSSDGDYYLDDVYKQRFYDKWIYEGKEFKMVFCDPHVDGMKWFRIFDNSKFIN